MTALSIFTFSNSDSLTEATTTWLAAELTAALKQHGKAVFFGAGGSTPAPVYQALSHMKLDWPSITVGLTDERWVPPGAPGSNEQMLRETLLQGNAAAANFLSMVTDVNCDPATQTAIIAERHRSAAKTPDIILAGMGPDAHTLSWFPGADGLSFALDPEGNTPIAAIHAQPSDVTGPYLARITLTLPVIARARAVGLLIRGKDKRNVLETAPPEAPIAHFVRAAGDKLKVFWCP